MGRVDMRKKNSGMPRIPKVESEDRTRRSSINQLIIPARRGNLDVRVILAPEDQDDACAVSQHLKIHAVLRAPG